MMDLLISFIQNTWTLLLEESSLSIKVERLYVGESVYFKQSATHSLRHGIKSFP